MWSLFQKEACLEVSFQSSGFSWSRGRLYHDLSVNGLMPVMSSGRLFGTTIALELSDLLQATALLASEFWSPASSSRPNQDETCVYRCYLVLFALNSEVGWSEPQWQSHDLQT